MLPDLSRLHVQRSGVCGGQLTLYQARRPSLRDGIKHAVNSFVAPRGCKPKLALAEISRYSNQMYPLHKPYKHGDLALFQRRKETVRLFLSWNVA